VRITGGEPALRKDLAERIRRCKNTPGIEKVALTTNGFSLVGQIDELKEAGT
jgi:cyclic pyranopterin phosphate synthase